MSGPYRTDERHSAGEPLHRSEEHFRLLVESVKDYGIFMLDPEGRVATWNEGAERIKGYEADEIIGEHFSRFHTQEDIERGHPEEELRIAATEGRYEEEGWRVRKDGSRFWANVVITALRDETGTLWGFAKVTRDVTERRQVEEALRQSEERFRALVQNASGVITILERDATIRYESPAIERVLGYEQEELVGDNAFDYVHPDDFERVVSTFTEALEKGEPTATVEFRFRHKDGSWRWFEGIGSDLLDEPSVKGIVVNSHDITGRKELEDRLTHQAFHDSLTGLPNRALFLDRLKQALARLSRHGSSVGVLFMDLDDFKAVNDSLGHECGDQLLVAVGQRLRELVRTEDTVARLSGDEFTILLEDITSASDAIRAAERVIEALRAPFKLGGTELFVRASVGIALGTSERDNPQALLRDADTAMYQAKVSSKTAYAVFSRSGET